MPAVAVLMSTYNGEKYLREQLDSIFSQVNVAVKLFVRDDGSKDGTVNILKEYAQKYPITLLTDGENVRPGESFMRLVYRFADKPELDFYAFADQDDIWLPKKLSTAIDEIKKGDNTVPTLYSSNQYIYADGKNEGYRHKEVQKTDLISHMTKNTIAGCTFVFNKALAQLISKAERPDSRIIEYRLHDSWLMLVAIVCGRVIYDDDSYMLYRIHAENVVGIKNVSVSEKMHRLTRMFNKRTSNIRMITANELLRLFPIMDNNDKRVLHLFADYKKSLKNKMALFCDNEIINGCMEVPIVFRFKVLLGVV